MKVKKIKNKKEKVSNSTFEVELFKAADKLRANMEPSDYKHVVLGLIFLKYISENFSDNFPIFPGNFRNIRSLNHCNSIFH